MDLKQDGSVHITGDFSMIGKCCSCHKRKNVLFYRQIKRETFTICHECLEFENRLNKIRNDATQEKSK